MFQIYLEATMPVHPRPRYRNLRFSALGAAALACVITLGLSSAAHATTQYPVAANVAEGFVLAAPNPAAPPAGVNVPGCVPSAAHPRPVVLITGLFGNMTDDWSGLGPTLANLGYCVYSAPIGGNPSSFVQTTGPVADSAKQISSLVNQVLATTGASQVDLIGHSEGGLIGEYYLKLLGGAPKAHTFVGLAPATHGSTADGIALLASQIPGATQVLGSGCPACADLLPGSAVLNAVDSGPIAQPGVSYTVIETRYDVIVTPPGSAFINEPGVTNEWLQDTCPLDTTGHLNLSYDPVVYGLVENALDPAHAQPVSCW
jgi:triacylglycerol esterase/lipase EstA (alpha/beta hydrolase family)